MSQDDTVPRGPIEAMERGPGPARYALPPALGQKEHDLRKWRAPAYSLSGITRPFKGNGVPGPSHYGINSELTRKGKDGTPRYSLASRNKDLKRDNFPSANTYKTENVWPQGERKRPSYTMGARVRYTQRENVPGPNQYQLPVLIGPKIMTSTKRIRWQVAPNYQKIIPENQVQVPIDPKEYPSQNPKRLHLAWVNGILNLLVF